MSDPMNDRKVFNVSKTEDFAHLSFYSLCKLSDFTKYAYPHLGLPEAIGRGEFKGVLTLDGLGNFISFE